MPRLRNAASCEKAVGRAVEWLRACCGGDEWTLQGQPLVTYHKAPYLLAISGHPEDARRALGWIKANLFTRDGDYRAQPPAAGQASEPALIREKAWVTLAAHITGRFDLSMPAARFFAQQQGGTTGGVYNLGADARREESADVRTTATAGMVFLMTGRVPQARLAGRFLVRMMQPQAGHDRFFVRLTPQGKLVCKFPRARAGSHVVAASDRHPAISYLGVPAIFLARLHLATEEIEWLETAMDYFAVAEQMAPEAIVAEDSSALAWAAGMLYGLTRRRAYAEFAERLTQAWLDRQRPDGSWRAHGAARDDGATLALTAQTALCLLECHREVQ